MSTSRRVALATTSFLFASIALVGCTASAPQVITTPGPTQTVTVTTTATPAPSGADSPVTPEEAWGVCLQAQLDYQNITKTPSTWNTYDPSHLTAITGGYTVTLRAQSSSEQSLFCSITGTVGSPKISNYLFQR